VKGQAVEQRRGHLGIAEYRRPFAERQIGSDDDRGALVEPADEMEQQLAAGLRERQIAEFVEDNEIPSGELIDEPALAVFPGFGLKPVDQVDNVEDAGTGTVTDACTG